MLSHDSITPATVRLPLHGRDGQIKAFAVIDAADAETVATLNWHLSYSGYARRKVGGGHEFLHRRLLGLPVENDGRQGDHINRDKLDNRRTNLRVLSHDENSQNRPSRKGASSRYRGVYLDKGAWRAQVRVGGVKMNLGSFAVEEEAAEAARLARLRLMPYAVD